MVVIFCKPEMTVAVSGLPEFSGNDEIIDGRGKAAALIWQKQ